MRTVGRARAAFSSSPEPSLCRDPPVSSLGPFLAAVRRVKTPSLQGLGPRPLLTFSASSGGCVSDSVN